MSTAISLSEPTISYPALVPNSRHARIIKANLGGEPMREQDLVKVATPAGGGTSWTVNVNGNDQQFDEIVGLLVAHGIRGNLWPSFDPTEARPVVTTNDGITGYRVGDDFGEVDPEDLEKFRTGDRTYDWVAMSNSKEFGFKSGKDGHGKRVKESRMLAILREGDTFPVLVSVGGGSIGEFLPWMKRLPAFHYECVIGLRLAKEKSAGGKPYSRIVPRLVGVISEAEGEVANEIYTIPLTAMFSQPPFGANS